MDFDVTTIRVFLHILGASVWVGGQIVLAALVPTLRGLGHEAPGKVALAFNRIAWPFFGLTVVTGVWHLSAVDLVDSTSSYQVGVMLKLLIVAVSGAAAFLHSSATKRSAIATWGVISGASALAAMLFGAVLVA